MGVYVRRRAREIDAPPDVPRSTASEPPRGIPWAWWEERQSGCAAWQRAVRDARRQHRRVHQIYTLMRVVDCTAPAMYPATQCSSAATVSDARAARTVVTFP
jgi:hypothetical protein